MPGSSRPLMLVAALGALLTLSACTADSGTGRTSFEGARKDVQEQITKLSDLAEVRNTSSICADLFTDRLEAEFAKLGGGRCSAAVDRAIRNADYTRIVVDAVTLNGDDKTATRAEARTIAETDGPKRGITLVRSDAKSAWRIDGFQATVAGTTPSATTPKTTP
jgi:hypothetical protein